MQPQPARARRSRERGRRLGRRRGARVQHDRGLRQSVAGDARDAGLADLARGDRGLDRADGPRPRLRRSCLPRRLRQDRACSPDGARACRQACRRSLQRSDARRTATRQRGDDPGRVGGGRRRGAGPDHTRGARRARAVRVSWSGDLCGPLHREHDGRCARLPRDHGARRRPDPGGRARRERRRRRASGHARRLAGGNLPDVPRPAGPPQRDDGDRGNRRLDERHPPPTGNRARGGRAPHPRRACRGGSAHAGDREPRAVRPLHGRGPAPRRRNCNRDPRAHSRRPVRRFSADGHGPNAGRSDAGCGGAGRRGRLSGRAAVQGDRGAPRAARQPCAGRQPRQSVGDGAPATARPGPRFRQRGDVHRCGAGRDRAGRRRARRSLRRAGGRPRHARDAERDRLRGRSGTRGVRRPRYRWSLLGRDPRADGGARRARGGTRRSARDRARRRSDS